METHISSKILLITQTGNLSHGKRENQFETWREAWREESYFMSSPIYLYVRNAWRSVISVNTADWLRLSVCKYVWENLYLFVWRVCLCVCSRVYTHLHVFLFKWPLVVFRGYLSAVSLQRRVRTHPSSLSTVVGISNFRVCVLPSIGVRKKRICYANHVWLLTQMREAQAAENGRSVVSSANLSVSIWCLTCDWQSVRCYLPLNGHWGWKWALIPQINVFLICVSPPGYL